MKKFSIFLLITLGTVTAFSQTINLMPDRVDSLIAVKGFVSPAKSFVVSGINLTNNIVFSGFDEWELSLSNTPFIATAINLTPVAGVVPPTTVYVRLKGYYFYPMPLTLDYIPIQSTGAATKNLTVTGVTKALEPLVQSTLSFGAVTNNSIAVHINEATTTTNKLLLVKESSPVDAEPEDLYTYYGGTYGNGSQLGTGNFVLYAPYPDVIVTGLSPNKTYYFAVFDFLRGNTPPFIIEQPGTENYLVPGGTGSATTNFGGPLPIIINYIKGTKQGSKHLLNWKVTCISTPRVTMELERSADSRNFTGISSITADAIRCDQPFDYTDTDPLKGMNYYRLKMTDADGKVSYSSIVALLNAAKGYDITGIAPNPVVTDNFKLNVASAQAGKMDITIFDMQGRLVNRQIISVIAGFNSLPVHINNLSSGTYTLKARMAEEQSEIIRFVKQ